jgi:hypothetical protein
MAYSHSELEISMLNLMIEKLGENSQLFYTSHNYDVLEMNLPSHSYVFMKKDEFVEVMHPEKLGYTKNDRNSTSTDSNVPLENLSSSRILPLSTIILSPLENLTI